MSTDSSARDVENARDAVCADIKRLQDQVEALQHIQVTVTPHPGATCYWCGYQSMEKAEAVEHALVCSAHPAIKRAQAAEKALAALNEAKHKQEKFSNKAKYCAVCIENYGMLYEVKKAVVTTNRGDKAKHRKPWVCPNCGCWDDYFVGEHLLDSLKFKVENICEVIAVLEK
jgi:rubrerythrin